MRCCVGPLLYQDEYLHRTSDRRNTEEIIYVRKGDRPITCRQGLWNMAPRVTELVALQLSPEHSDSLAYITSRGGLLGIRWCEHLFQDPLPSSTKQNGKSRASQTHHLVTKPLNRSCHRWDGCEEWIRQSRVSQTRVGPVRLSKSEERNCIEQHLYRCHRMSKSSQWGRKDDDVERREKVISMRSVLSHD